MKFPLIKRANITPSAAEGESFHRLIIQNGVDKAVEGLSQADLTSYYLSYNAYLASEVGKGGIGRGPRANKRKSRANTRHHRKRTQR